MGGMGSGRRNQCGKQTTSSCLALDIASWQRDALLSPCTVFSTSWHTNGTSIASLSAKVEDACVTLDYRHKRGNAWQEMNYPVSIEWINCNLGGRRAWFHCPKCGRRVAILYLGGAGIFACRNCHKLAYECQRETADDRARRRADKLQRRIGLGGGLTGAAEWRRPKGMHWCTYVRLTYEHNAFLDISLAGMAARLGLVERQLTRIGDDLHGGR